ncbi:Lactoylglutathione lyase / glyoxalase I family protein [Hibiscus syriacus]|uniref:Lactoylglutathione lyase / glyoxalase I family protein n=1 Tax=Hibiscus syriacus TaxID=106335 RepID=A0A6A3AXQ4_HIBSY|nr:Lactoylglutathione lyase / glyoxalase I family protein [Hibiscus syriacus]
MIIAGLLGWVALASHCCWYHFLVCTLLTGISLRPIAANSAMKGGGPYYQIGRALGPEVGVSIGLCFFLGNAVAGALYVLGAVETFLKALPSAGIFTETTTKVNGTVSEPIQSISTHDLQIYGIVVTIILCFIVFGAVKMINRVAPAFLIPVLFSIFCIFVGGFLAKNDDPAPTAACSTTTTTEQPDLLYLCLKEYLGASKNMSMPVLDQIEYGQLRSNEAKLNAAFDSAENVILVFSVNRTLHFQVLHYYLVSSQGCAKMTSKIGGSVAGGNWKHAHGTGLYGRNFSISRDCQELEPSVGEQLASLLSLEPDWALMDNEEEEEEEEESEEDESFSSAAQGRGRGRGVMWSPHMPLARDLFGASRPFAPYGPRFSGDFTGPAFGMMFPGRSPQPGAVFPSGGMSPPFMTGANPARGGWPVGIRPMFPLPPASSSQNSGQAIKRDQRTPTNDRSSARLEQGRGQEVAGMIRHCTARRNKGSQGRSVCCLKQLQE